MSKGKKIFVRRKHIKEGNKFDPFSCPIALACAEQVGGVFRVKSEGLSQVDENYRPIKAFAPLTKTTNFINRFDGGKAVKPFTFVLREL